MYAAETCRPWSFDCPEPAADVHVAMCCGKEFPLCVLHSIEARTEAAGCYCLVCGETYTDSTWVIVPIEVKTGGQS